MTGSVQEISSEVGEFVPSAWNSEILTYLAWAQGWGASREVEEARLSRLGLELTWVRVFHKWHFAKKKMQYQYAPLTGVYKPVMKDFFS